ncbi:hypothetical protein O9929_18545 [Vibrio lentus]|nr:hypothetical protein [Vibrio lentus]
MTVKVSQEREARTGNREWVRLDETTPGTGLGLNIVNEMAHSCIVAA